MVAGIVGPPYQFLGLHLKRCGELADCAASRLDPVAIDADNGRYPHARAFGKPLLG